MKYLRKIAGLCALTLALCLALPACSSGPKQTAADSAEEATLNFLTNLQNGEFDMAKTYLDEGNPLLYVFPAGEGEEAPELDGVYRQFCEKMKGLAFHVAEEGTVGNSMVYIAAKPYDFRHQRHHAGGAPEPVPEQRKRLCRLRRMDGAGHCQRGDG